MKLKKIKVFFLALLLGTMPAARADLSKLEKEIFGITGATVGLVISGALMLFLETTQDIRADLNPNAAKDTFTEGNNTITSSDINIVQYLEGLQKALASARQAAYQKAYDEAILDKKSPVDADAAGEAAKTFEVDQAAFSDYTITYFTENSVGVTGSSFESYLMQKYPIDSGNIEYFEDQINALNDDRIALESYTAKISGYDGNVLKFAIEKNLSMTAMEDWLEGKSQSDPNAAEYISEFMPISETESAGVLNIQLEDMIDSYATAGETRLSAINDIQDFLSNGFDIPVSTSGKAGTYASKLDFLIKVTNGNELGFTSLKEWLSGTSIEGEYFDSAFIQDFVPQGNVLNSGDVMNFVQKWVGTGEAGNVSVGIESLLDALGGTVGINGLTLPSGYTNNLDYLIKNGFTNLTQVKALRAYVQNAARGATQGDLPANWDPVNPNPVPHGSTTQTAQEEYEQLESQDASSIKAAESNLTSGNETQGQYDTLVTELRQELEDAEAAGDTEAEAQIQQEMDEDQTLGEDDDLNPVDTGV